MNPKMYRISKVKRQINFGKNYRINTRLNLKTKFIWAKEKHTIISEMSWNNVLWGSGSDSCVNDEFRRFSFKDI